MSVFHTATSRHWGSLWALLLLVLAVALPRPGGWTIDDGVKRAAAEQGTGIWAEMIPDGEIRAQLRDPGAFAALKPPFAYRAPGGLGLGFSPLTRTFFKAFAWSEAAFRIALALIVIALWVLMERAKLPYAFVLLPLTFYGLVPWEHGLSWLLLWPATWAVLVQERPSPNMLGIGGVLAALAPLLRPETALLSVSLGAVLLARRHMRGLLAYAGAGTLILGSFVLLHGTTAQEPLWVQFALNEVVRPGMQSWLVRLPTAAWVLLIMMDRNVWISTFMLMVLLAAILLLDVHERKHARLTLISGWVLIVLWLATYEYRLWSSTVPPLTIGWSNSLLATLPWVIVLARPPYRGRPALWIAAAVMGLTILMTPAWQGVHWGPRMLLFAMPLLVIDLHRTGRMRGPLMGALVAVTIIQTVSSAGLAYARDRELANRCRAVDALTGRVVVFPTTAHAADLAPLWKGREFFTAVTEREFRQLMMEFRRIGVDTCWLHAVYWDPMYFNAFPDERPVTPVRETLLYGEAIYSTRWRIYELALNRADTAWVPLLQGEAGMLLNEGDQMRALDLQTQAVELAPGSAAAHHNLALVYSALGRTNDARAEVQRALELDPFLREAQRLRDLLESADTESP